MSKVKKNLQKGAEGVGAMGQKGWNAGKGAVTKVGQSFNKDKNKNK